MKISFHDTSYCNIELESETDSDRFLLRQIYLKLISKNSNKQRIHLAKILEDLE